MKRKKNTRAIPPTACCEASLSAWAAGPFRTPARVVGSRKSAKKNAPGRFTIKRKKQGARGVCSIFCVFLRFLAARGVCSRWGRLLRSSRYFYSVLHGIFTPFFTVFFPSPRSRLRIWSRETDSAVPSRFSLLISILRRILCLLTGFLPSSAVASIYLFKPPHAIGQFRVYRVTQLRTDGVHCR